ASRWLALPSTVRAAGRGRRARLGRDATDSLAWARALRYSTLDPRRKHQAPPPSSRASARSPDGSSVGIWVAGGGAALPFAVLVALAVAVPGALSVSVTVTVNGLPVVLA